jgi:hypothetical protein
MLNLMSLKRTRILFASAALVSSLIVAPLNATAEMPVVVELFTSQGCSNCPPADAFLTELAKRDDVIALSYPITYWDHLGWADTLARPEHSERQRGYNRTLGKDMVYTPEMVIDGATHEVGSRKDIVAAKIEQARSSRSGHGAAIAVTKTNGRIILDIPTAPAAAQACTVWFVPFIAEETVAIGNGENKGRTVTYTNVARVPRYLGTWNGEEKSIALELSSEFQEAFSGFALLIQDAETGPIRAATKVMLK